MPAFLLFLAPYKDILMKILGAVFIAAVLFGSGFMVGQERQRSAITSEQLKATEKAVLDANAASYDRLADQIAAQADRENTAKLFRDFGSKVEAAIAKNKRYSDPNCGLTPEDVKLWNQMNKGKAEEPAK